VRVAGGSPDDIVHFLAFARDGITADDFTPSWLARFPNEGDRPARKTWMRLPLPFGDERIVFQATAMIGGGQRSNYEVFGVRHREPLPLGARVGPLFMSSGIPGTTPHESDPAGLGPFPATLGEQLDNGVRDTRALDARSGWDARQRRAVGGDPRRFRRSARSAHRDWNALAGRAPAGASALAVPADEPAAVASNCSQARCSRLRRGRDETASDETLILFV